MNQALMPTASVQPALYDLLARSYALEAPVGQVCFDPAGKACAFALADGRVALLPLDETDSPLKRVRLEFDSGRSLIRPREQPAAPPILTQALVEGMPLLAPSSLAGFLVTGPCGRLTRLTPRGQELPLLRQGPPISRFAADGRGLLARASNQEVILAREEAIAETTHITLPSPALGLAFGPKDGLLAIQLADGLILRDAHGALETVALPGTGHLQFSRDSAWLAGSSSSGFWLRRMADGQSAQLDKFPQAPLSLGFSQEAIFVDGAYRLAGWSLATPPFDAPATGALRSGGMGLILTTAVAPHPTRPLIATGRADGAVSLVQPGSSTEMALRHGEGAAVSQLGWSQDGLHLAIGTQAGDIALLTLPPQLFR